MAKRLSMWETGDMLRLLEHVEAMKQAMAKPPPNADNLESAADEWKKRGERAKFKTTKMRYRKAIMDFTTKGAAGSPAVRSAWADRLIVRASPTEVCRANNADITDALSNHMASETDDAMFDFLATKTVGKFRVIPQPTFPPLSAPGPTGERGEHLDISL